MDILLFLYYGYGWCGAILLLTSLVYVLYNIRMLYKPKSKRGKKFLSNVNKLYKWIGIKWDTEDVVNSKIPMKLVILLALYTTLGTVAFVVSFIVAVLVFLTTITYQIIYKYK